MNLNELKQSYIDNKIDKPSFIKKMYLDHHCHLFDYKNNIANTDIKKIEITERGVIFTSREHGIKMLCLEGDYRLAPLEILNFNNYEPEETNMMLNLIPKKARIFDIGANAGWYSILFAKLNTDSKVFAYEPIPRTFNLLVENIKMNNVNNIHYFNYGISDKTQDLEFFYFQEGSGNASSKNVSENETAEKIICHVKSLDNCIDDIADGVDFIKCDVEGAELLVFKGALKTIGKHKPIIFSEMLRKWSIKYNYHPNDIIIMFANLGYHCFTVENSNLKLFKNMDDETVETNFFFLHKYKHKKEINYYMNL